MTNKLTRSNDRMVLGVAAGMAARTGMDATLIRVLFVLFTLAGGPGLIAYALILMISTMKTTIALTMTKALILRT